MMPSHLNSCAFPSVVNNIHTRITKDRTGQGKARQGRTGQDKMAGESGLLNVLEKPRGNFHAKYQTTWKVRPTDNRKVQGQYKVKCHEINLCCALIWELLAGNKNRTWPMHGFPRHIFIFDFIWSLIILVRRWGSYFKQLPEVAF